MAFKSVLTPILYYVQQIVRIPRFCKREDRWERLVRYAQFRSNRLRLDHLPGDVLYHMAYWFLSPDDLCKLVEALLGYAPDMGRPTHVADVAPELQALWVQSHAQVRLQNCIHSLSEFCFFHARNYTAVLVFIDWSPFAPSSPSPVAEFCWMQTAPYARMTLYHTQIIKSLQDAFAQHRSCVQVSIYTWSYWNGTSVLHNRPVHLTSVALTPHFLS